MVNRKAVAIASFAVAVLIAAAVVVAVIFTIVLPVQNGEPDAPTLETPNPGMKRMESNGNISSGNWLMTYRGDVDVNAVKDEMGISSSNNPLISS